MRRRNWKEIIIWILIILTAVIILWYIFGSSPTFEQALLVFMLTALFTIVGSISKTEARLSLLETRFNKLEENVKDSFNKMKEDMDLIKKKLKIKS